MFRMTSIALIAVTCSGLLAGTILAPLPALAKKASSPSAAPAASDSGSASNPVIVRVNGDPIYRSDVDAEMQQIVPPGQHPSTEELQKIYPQVVSDLISKKLAYQEAVREKLNATPEVRKVIARETAMVEHQVMVQAYFDEIGKPAVNDDALHKAYDEALKTASKDEIHARHILLKTEDEAKDVIKQLDKGADFQTLAKEKSIDKSNGQDGGDLGYFSKGSLDPTFTDAAFAMQNNTYSKTPVKTSFGYDVIQVLDRRPAKIPSFEEAKPQLRAQLAQIAISKKLNELFNKSKVESYGPDGTSQIAHPQTPAPAATAPASGNPAPSSSDSTPLKLPQTPSTP
jgi:peptidyl-prolyl cis-trans isomerase C